MSTHIAAEPGQIAPIVLFPGDPLRAKWIAETFLDDAELYSETRGMLGFTGTWEGHRVSVQGSGMGQPSMAIYANELFDAYDVQTIVRVGSCGALTERVKIRDIIIANGASTDSGINRVRFHGLDYAPVADFSLLRAAVEASEAESLESTVHVGQLFSSDQFYSTRPSSRNRSCSTASSASRWRPLVSTPSRRTTVDAPSPSARSAITSSRARRPRHRSASRRSAT